MGFACNRVRHKSKRDCNQKQNQHHHQQIIQIENSIDRSSNSIRFKELSRRRQRDKNRYERKNSVEISSNQRIKTNSIPNHISRDDGNDIDITFENMDDENMVESSTITKSIPSNRRKSLTPILDATKCKMNSNQFEMNSTTMCTDHQIVCRCKYETMSKLRALFAAQFWFAGSNSISRFIHMINFKRKNLPNNTNNNNHNINNNNQQKHHHHIFTLSPSQHTEQIENIAPTKIKLNTYNNKNKNQIKTKHERQQRIINNNMNDSVHNRCDQIKSIYNRGHNNRSIITSSQCFIRQSVCLYAASGFLIALCFLAIPAAASIDSLHPM